MDIKRYRLILHVNVPIPAGEFPPLREVNGDICGHRHSVIVLLLTRMVEAYCKMQYICAVIPPKN
ncbi:hypothetical protein, partial [Aeromonas caviae]|uniref:hypothetical protein n=1 Tax=Aeromonas caviae TaxID=648 RepID=UPI0029DDB30C